MEDIKKYIDSFDEDRINNKHRYASFDFCYEYFYYNRGNLLGGNLQISCSQLWSYLGSWGMVARGNELQNRSYASLVDIISVINNNPEYYSIAIDSKNYVEKMMNLSTQLEEALHFEKQKSTKTVVTKIMLGAFACCPAFDNYFCKTFGTSTMGSLTKKNLQSIVEFYTYHKKIIDSISIYTLHFSDSDKKDTLPYTSAKIIDMYGFEKGLSIN